MMAENLDDGEFWLPPQLLTDDDILMDFNQKTHQSNVSRKNWKADSGLVFPSGFGPYCNSDLSSPVESVVSSTETESDEDEYLAGLTRQLARSALLDDLLKADSALGYENPKMRELVDIARCVVCRDLSELGFHEFLLACIEDLQDVLHHSKIKALVVDTFGGRIESLLREKYTYACDLLDGKSTKSSDRKVINSKKILDSASQSSSTSSPMHPSHKEWTSIEDFEIIKPISRGAFGKVFLVRKRATGDFICNKAYRLWLVQNRPYEQHW